MDTNLGRSRLSEQIQESILDAIRAGEFPAGQKLPSERSLMEMFEVGRPSVKEALLMLERKGFVRLQRGVAPVVVQPTPESAIGSIGDMVSMMLAEETRRSEFYGLRIMLETCAALDAARERDPAVIAGLEEALEHCRATAGQAAPFRDADQAFHRCLMAASRNGVADAFHRSLIEWGLFNPETGPELDRIHARVIAQHVRIIEAVRDGDCFAAAEALRRHLQTRHNAAREDG
ncbi:MAG: GntR family transcriptional regulator [Tropicimonas sp.]|uniref:GntR family transcriptional regulator n=1 Tax=Tropicimonas sp. TaxID=2067044 RepID=UPI003A84D3D3